MFQFRLDISITSETGITQQGYYNGVDPPRYVFARYENVEVGRNKPNPAEIIGKVSDFWLRFALISQATDIANKGIAPT